MTKYPLITSLCIAAGLASCKSKCVPAIQSAETTKTITIQEVVHDTVFKIEKDNSYYQALVECRDNKVVLTDQWQQQEGKNLKAPQVSIKDNVLSVDCEAKAHELFAQWKSQYKTETLEIIKTVPVEKNLSFWQEFQIWCGRILFVAVGIYLVKRSYF